MLGAWMNLEDLILSEISQRLCEVPGFPWWLSGKEVACQCRRLAFNPWVGKIPWRRAWQPTPVFLPWRIPWAEKLGGLQSAAAAAKSLHSCPTLCDPIDSSPLGSAVPGILQARILELVAISFSRESCQPRE